ncbi:Spo0E family sporulation regulatory protein-aspartic acid phosphatase [Clostridium formicaceticum]|uniref:Spo0E like sporulation regulatory protein n=1 Tax=Clostridium formicaceticum TaxID=1497 RepID=A0AAC9RKH2_9CLOT|nr:Spo0E family sporulation regulatory protein-aspartic acid phosphatase [Clostridium formicaceticum]ARE85925.1 Spo0E like sporulation regulatory protein [Clostridium formicaceticum]
MIKMKKCIEELRKQLDMFAKDIDNRNKEKLLEISQEMDKVINDYISKRKV